MVSTHESDKDHVKKVDCAMGKYAKGLDNVCQIILKTTGQECMWSTEDIGIVFITFTSGRVEPINYEDLGQEVLRLTNKIRVSQGQCEVADMEPAELEKLAKEIEDVE